MKSYKSIQISLKFENINCTGHGIYSCWNSPFPSKTYV